MWSRPSANVPSDAAIMQLSRAIQQLHKSCHTDAIDTKVMNTKKKKNFVGKDAKPEKNPLEMHGYGSSNWGVKICSVAIATIPGWNNRGSRVQNEIGNWNITLNHDPIAVTCDLILRSRPHSQNEAKPVQGSGNCLLTFHNVVRSPYCTVSCEKYGKGGERKKQKCK